ncbi:hypothetical protein DFJ73DRAFT_799802 [Zopfochytrium polystomum]|nr:hypothetical protein DFJ73DRAFT_799802 [Zopfochytrium polystomum]
MTTPNATSAGSSILALLDDPRFQRARLPAIIATESLVAPAAAATNTTTTPSSSSSSFSSSANNTRPPPAPPRWLGLSRISFAVPPALADGDDGDDDDGAGDARGEQQQQQRILSWETCDRISTAPPNDNDDDDDDWTADAVDVVARITHCAQLDGDNDGGGGDRLVLVIQYRPPLRAFAIEFPSGLVDPGESAAAAALRELAEENRPTSYEPGMTSSCSYVVNVEIDGRLPENRAPAPRLERDEWSLLAFSTPIDSLHQDVLRLEARLAAESADGGGGGGRARARRPRIVVDSRVVMFAEGLSMANAAAAAAGASRRGDS